MIKSLFALLTVSTISTSALACLPPPEWKKGSSEMGKILSSIRKIVDTIGENTAGLRVDALAVTGIQSIGHYTYQLSLRDTDNRKSCSTDVEVEYVAIAVDPEALCAPSAEVAIKSVGPLTCK